MIDQVPQLGQAVGTEDEGRVAGLRQEQLEELLPRGGVEARRRLVHDEQLAAGASASAISSFCRIPPERSRNGRSATAARSRSSRSVSAATRSRSTWRTSVTSRTSSPTVTPNRGAIWGT